MVNFNSGQSVYWSDKLKLEYLQRQIIVHSILYYEMHENVIEDFQFDQLCRQYMEMVKHAGSIPEKTQYRYVFKDFDGTTGFYIYDRLKQADKEHLSFIANHVLCLYKKGEG